MHGMAFSRAQPLPFFRENSATQNDSSTNSGTMPLKKCPLGYNPHAWKKDICGTCARSKAAHESGGGKSGAGHVRKSSKDLSAPSRAKVPPKSLSAKKGSKSGAKSGAARTASTSPRNGSKTKVGSSVKSPRSAKSGSKSPNASPPNESETEQEKPSQTAAPQEKPTQSSTAPADSGATAVPPISVPESSKEAIPIPAPKKEVHLSPAKSAPLTQTDRISSLQTFTKASTSTEPAVGSGSDVERISQLEALLNLSRMYEASARNETTKKVAETEKHYKEKLQQLEAQLEEKKAECLDLKSAKDDRVEGLNLLLKSTRAELAAAQAASKAGAADTQADHADSTHELAATKEKLAAAETALQEMQAKLAEAEAKVKASQEMQAKLAEAEAKLTASRHGSGALNALQAKLEQADFNLLDKNSKSDKRIAADLQAKLAEAEAKLKASQDRSSSDLKALQAQLDQAEANAKDKSAKSDERITTLEKEVAALTRKLHDTEAAAVFSSSKNEGESVAKAELVDVLKTLKSSQEKERATAEELSLVKTRLDKAEAEIKEKSGQAREGSDRISSMEAELIASRTKLDEADAKLKASEAAAKASAASYTVDSTRVAELEVLLQQSQKRAEALEQQMTATDRSLKSELQTLEKKLTEADAELKSTKEKESVASKELALIKTQEGEAQAASKEKSDRIESLEAELKKHKDQEGTVRALQTKLDEVDTKLKKSEAAVKASSSGATENTRVAELEVLLKKGTETESSLRGKIQGLQKELSEAREKLSSLSSGTNSGALEGEAESQKLTHHLRPKVKRGGAKRSTAPSFQGMSTSNAEATPRITLATMTEEEQRDAARASAAPVEEAIAAEESKAAPSNQFRMPAAAMMTVKLKSRATSAKGNSHARKPPFEVPLENEDAVLDAMEALGERGNRTCWVMLTYGKAFDFQRSGEKLKEEGCMEICEFLDDAQVQYIFFNLLGKAEASPEIALLVWLGANCKVRDKASSHPRSMDLMTFSKRFFTCKANIKITEKEQVEIQHIVDQMRGGSGSVTSKSSTAVQDEREALALKAVQQTSNPARNSSPLKTPSSPFTPSSTFGSLDLELKGQESVSGALAAIKNGKGWVGMTLQGRKFNEISAIGHSVSEDALTPRWVAQYLQPDRHATFIIRLESTSGHGLLLTQTVCLHWIGQELRAQTVGRVKEATPLLTKYLDEAMGTLHLHVEARRPDEVTREQLKEKLQGTRQKWGNKKAVLSTGDEKFAKFGKGSKEEVRLADEVKLLAELRKLANDPHDSSLPHLAWVLMGYQQQSTSVLEIQATGDVPAPDLLRSPVPDFKPLLKDDQVQFLAYRLMRIPGQYDEVNSQMDRAGLSRPNYGLCLWHGPQISVMRKAVSSHHWKFLSDRVRQAMDEYGTPVSVGYAHAEAKYDGAAPVNSDTDNESQTNCAGSSVSSLRESVIKTDSLKRVSRELG
eukprot:g32388.t1